MKMLMVALIFFCGCSTEAIRRSLRAEMSPRMSCPEDEIDIQDYKVGGLFIIQSTWVAVGCGRTFACRHIAETRGTSPTECEETAESKASTEENVVVDRLALETGCASKNIAVVSKSDWSRGDEKAFRLDACGKAYVCTTAPGRTDCKEALAQTP